MVTRTCRECGEIFEAQVPSTRPGSGKYCSIACHRKAQRARAEDRASRIRRTCSFCDQEFTPTVRSGIPSKYCSRSCWAAGVRAARTQTVTLTCASCGKTYERPKAWVRKSGSKYCSRACQGVGRQRADSTSHRGTGWRKIAARIRQRDELRCVRCSGQDEGRELAVDHIVPWVLVSSDETAANSDANLASLCLSCHGTKTASIEPRLLRGDWLALQEFYGKPTADAAFAAVQHAIKVPG
jgi:5-methylcytosine-specific restriction endonuclease McrA